MDAAAVYRVISLIPDRAARAPSGTGFALHDGHSPRIALLMRFLHWLGPLSALSKEEQQALGVRSGGGKAMGAEDDGDMLPEDDLPEFEDDPEKTPLAPLGLEEQRLEGVRPALGAPVPVDAGIEGLTGG